LVEVRIAGSGRAAIVAGAALVLMETLADFGAVSDFAVDTLSAGIYRAWQGMGDSAAARSRRFCLLAWAWSPGRVAPSRLAVAEFLDASGEWRRDDHFAARARVGQSLPVPFRSFSVLLCQFFC
jgi:hypothetical protein